MILRLRRFRRSWTHSHCRPCALQKKKFVTTWRDRKQRRKGCKKAMYIGGIVHMCKVSKSWVKINWNFYDFMSLSWLMISPLLEWKIWIDLVLLPSQLPTSKTTLSPPKKKDIFRNKSRCFTILPCFKAWDLSAKISGAMFFPSA